MSGADTDCEAGIAGGCGACATCDPEWWEAKAKAEAADRETVTIMQRRVKMTAPAVCSVCRGRGWAVFRSDEYGADNVRLLIQRCNKCMAIATDTEAEQAARIYPKFRRFLAK